MNINTQFKNIIDNSELYSCEDLPFNSKASHIIKNKKDENNLVLPIKLYIENPSQTWVPLKSSYRGIIILWITKDNKSLVIHTSELKFASTITSTLLSKYKDLLCKFSDIPNKITNYYNKDYLIDITKKEKPSRKPTQFQDIINNSKLYSCEELPLNCRTSHIIKYKKDNKNENVLPIKLYIENKAFGWNLNANLYRGIVVLWLTESEKSLVIHTNELRSLRTRSSSILLQYKNLLCNFSDIPNKISNYYKKEHLITRVEVLKNTKYEVLSREEIKNTRPDTNILEALAHEEITALLCEDKYKLTPEKCKADAGYYDGNLIDKYIGIQVKSATFQKNGKLNMFHNINKYSGLLLFCRPMKRVYIGTFVIPGSLVETNEIGCNFSENAKYTPYLVPDPLLNNFMSGLYLSVINNEKTYEWPSGKIIDISSFILKPFDEFCKPESKTDLKENASANWRKEKYPNLSYIVPKVQGTAVDIIINDVRLQDKHGAKFKGHIGYVVNFQKNGGRHIKHNQVPYEVGDFDGAFVYLSDTYKYVFVIPSFELEKRGILKSDTSDGLTCFTVYTLDYKKTKFGKEADTWAQKYCIDTEAEDSEENLKILLEKCKS
jgi:hypothetical protein